MNNTAQPNMSSLERVLTAVGGGALTAYGVTRHSKAGAAIAMLGGGLMVRSLAGHCPGYAAAGIPLNKALLCELVNGATRREAVARAKGYVRSAMEAAWATPQGAASDADLPAFADLSRTTWSVVEEVTLLE